MHPDFCINGSYFGDIILYFVRQKPSKSFKKHSCTYTKVPKIRLPSQLPLCVILIPSIPRQTALTLCLSADETAVYAVSSRGVFSAWSMYQSGQRVFEHRLDDPYFAQDAVYPRNCWGRQFALAAGGKHILSCSTSGGVIYRFDNRRMVKVLGLKVGYQFLDNFRTFDNHWSSYITN